MKLRDMFATAGRPAKCGSHHARPGAAHLGYNRLCHLEDFEHPDLLAELRNVFDHEFDRFGVGFPSGREYRKHWEVAMATRTLRDFGALHDRAEVLGVGAGNEPTIFWLTRHVRRVFATDLYLEDGSWKCSANASMLADPGRHWPPASPWHPRRLVVQHMNALELRYEDRSFDAVFSSSSIEHFGSLDDVRRALAEMARVMKPGGILSLSTEFRLAGPPPGLPGTLLFDADELRRTVLADLPWEPVDPLDLSLSDATRRSALDFSVACASLRRHTEEHGQIVFHRLDWDRYPALVLSEPPHLWTSLHLALRKAAG